MFQIFYLFFTTIETSLFVFTIYSFSKMLVATKILCGYIFCNIVRTCTLLFMLMIPQQ